jgi:hypothetical protein
MPAPFAKPMCGGLVAVLAALLAAPLAAGPFDGLYRPDYPETEGWDCRSIGSDGGALAIEGDLFKASKASAS